VPGSSSGRHRDRGWRRVPAGSRVGGSSSAVEAPGDDGDGGREGDSGDGDTQKILAA
jgi:hypothetical protein